MAVDGSKRRELVSWLALVVAIVAVLISSGSLWIAYQESRLSGRFAPKLSFAQYTVLYRLSGSNELWALSMMIVDNFGTGPAKDISFEVVNLPERAETIVEGVDYNIAKKDSDARLFHVPLLASGWSFRFACEPLVVQDPVSYPYIKFLNSPDGPIPINGTTEREFAAKWKKRITVDGLKEFHGDKAIEIVDEITFDLTTDEQSE